MDWYYVGFGLLVILAAYAFLKITTKGYEKQIKQLIVERTLMSMTISATADMLTKYIEKYGFEIMENEKHPSMKQMIKAFQKELAKKKQAEQKV